jgi:hypothetical protein
MINAVRTALTNERSNLKVVAFSFIPVQMPKFVSFCEQYARECANVGQAPLEWVTASSQTEVALDVDKVSANAWPPLIKALSAASDLTKLCVFSSSGHQPATSKFLFSIGSCAFS